jgi:hypothetical protein
MIRIRKFTETLESERELRIFVDKLIPFISKALYAVKKNDFNHLGDRDKIIAEKARFQDDGDLFIGGITFSGESGTPIFVIPQKVYNSKFLYDFYEYLLGDTHKFKKALSIAIMNFNSKNTTRGYYSSKNNLLVIYLTKEMTEDILLSIQYFNESKSVSEINKTISSSYARATLLHEITHAYDYFRGDEEKIGKSVLQPESGFLDYSLQTHEINAFYSSVVQKAEDLGDKYTHNFKHVLNLVKYNSSLSYYLGDDIPEDVKKRILNRFYQWYAEPPATKAEMKLAKDICYTEVWYRVLLGNFNDIKIFEFKEFLQPLSMEIKGIDTPSMKGLLSAKEAFDYLIQWFKEFPRKGKRGVAYAQRDLEGKRNKYYTITLIIDEMGYYFSTYNKDFVKDFPSGRDSQYYRMIESFLKFLKTVVGYTALDYESINSFLKKEHQIPVGFISRDYQLVDYIRD